MGRLRDKEKGKKDNKRKAECMRGKDRKKKI